MKKLLFIPLGGVDEDLMTPSAPAPAAEPATEPVPATEPEPDPV